MELIKDKLSPIQQAIINKLERPDNFHGIQALAEDLVVIIIMVIIAEFARLHHPYLYPPILVISIIMISARMRGLATLVHDASHNMLFESRRLNEAIGTLCAYMVGQVFSAYRSSHGVHHSELGNVNFDPDMRGYVDFNAGRGNRSIRNYVLQLALGMKIHQTVSYLFSNRLLPAAPNARSLLDYAGFHLFWSAILILSILFDFWLQLIIYWFWPYFTTFQAINWLIELSEHYPRVFMEGESQCRKTRNRRGSALENFLFGIHGDNWHAVHHACPRVPFWNLQAAHEVLLSYPEYAESNLVESGLFTCGITGGASILEEMDAWEVQA